MHAHEAIAAGIAPLNDDGVTVIAVEAPDGLERPTPEPRRQRKMAMKREAILRSAARAFSRRGYHGTSLDDISAELLMTKGALYYYFKDKEDILFACHDYSLNLVLDQLARAQAMHAETSDKLAYLLRTLVEVILDALQGSALALEFTSLSPELFRQIVAKRDRFERGLRGLIEQGIAEGTFAPADPKLATFMILGAINWIPKWYRAGGTYDAVTIGDQYAGLFIAALRSGSVPTFQQGRDAARGEEASATEL